MTDTPFSDKLARTRLHSASRGLFWTGLVMLVLGVAAILFPIVSTLAAALMVGWMILFFGTVSLFGSFSIHGTGPFFGALLLSLLAIAGGLFLLLNPVAGAASLTLLVAGLFSVQGAFEISFAFEMRPHQGWAGMLVSGIASVIVAVLIVATWPGISLILLGVLVGINFVSTGVAQMLLSSTLKRLG